MQVNFPVAFYFRVYIISLDNNKKKTSTQNTESSLIIKYGHPFMGHFPGNGEVDFHVILLCRGETERHLDHL